MPIRISPWFVWVALWRWPGHRCGFFSSKGSTRRPFGFYVLGLDVGWRGWAPWTPRETP